ncbi:hypothetical protein AFLA_004554 [Aspergillus flavus NRRL3357]|nr:hypothetical protein AFLA_004554 [Aspergillus flavus NRRL3357]
MSRAYGSAPRGCASGFAIQQCSRDKKDTSAGILPERFLPLEMTIYEIRGRNYCGIKIVEGMEGSYTVPTSIYFPF